MNLKAKSVPSSSVHPVFRYIQLTRKRINGDAAIDIFTLQYKKDSLSSSIDSGSTDRLKNGCGNALQGERVFNPLLYRKCLKELEQYFVLIFFRMMQLFTVGW